MNILIYTPMFTLGSRVESLMHRLSVWSTNQNARLRCAALWLVEDAENWYSRKNRINPRASEFQNKRKDWTMQPKSNIKQTNIRHFDLRKNLTTFWLSEHITVGSWSEHVSSCLCQIHGFGKSLQHILVSIFLCRVLYSFVEIRFKLYKCFHATLGWNSPQAAAAIASALYTTTTTQHGLEKTEQCCSIVLCTRKLILECVAMTFPSHEFGINYYLRAQISYQQ